MQFNINNDNHNNDDNNDGHNDGNNDNQNQIVVPANVPAGQAAQTTLAFKVEQSKIPEFYGQKCKDNITAIVFIMFRLTTWPGPTGGTTLPPTRT